MTDTPHTPEPLVEPASLGQLFEQLSDQTTRLVKTEVALAKAEMQEKAKDSGVAIGLIVFAALTLFWMTNVFIWAAILGLGEAWPLWLSALVIGVFGVLVAAGAGFAAYKLLQRAANKPETIDRVKADAEAVKLGAQHHLNNIKGVNNTSKGNAS
ncbi:MAG: phage holin family protein [Cellulomonadaceae bacterium]|nr:phage holin family protein [Cellulomonadaceae bacterium]